MPTTDEDQFKAAITEGAESFGLSASAARSDVMWRHFELLRAANARFNLTRITEPVAAAAKLYVDALAPLAWLRDAGIPARYVLDVGTGAGFPAIPYAVACPDARVMAVDSTGKKTDFVRDCARQLAIGNLEVERARAGEWCAPRMYDLVLFKAVGPLARCLEFSRGYLARDGCIIVFKGRNLSREELDAGQTQAEELNLLVWDAVDYTIACGEETLEHTLVIYRRL